MHNQIDASPAMSDAVKPRLTKIAFFRVTDSERAELDALTAERG